MKKSNVLWAALVLLFFAATPAFAADTNTVAFGLAAGGAGIGAGLAIVGAGLGFGRIGGGGAGAIPPPPRGARTDPAQTVHTPPPPEGTPLFPPLACPT